MVPSEGVLGGSEQAAQRQSFMADGQDFFWDSSAWRASAPSATKKKAVLTSTIRVSKVSGEKGKGESRCLLALKRKVSAPPQGL